MKACLNQSFQLEIIWKILCWVIIYFKTWPEMSVCTHASELQARRRGFYKYKLAWSCHVMLHPILTEGKPAEGGMLLSSCRTCCGFWKFAIQRKKETETVQSLSKVKRNQLFPNPFPQNLSSLLRSTQASNKLLVRALIWDTQMPGLGPDPSFPLCDQKLGLAMGCPGWNQQAVKPVCLLSPMLI